MSEHDGAQGERVIAIRPGALGDALLALPALAWLRRARQGVRVLFVAREDVLALTRASKLTDETSSYESPLWGALFTDKLASAETARALVEGATAVAWMRDAEGTVARNLRALGARGVLMARGRPEPGERVYTALLLARGLELLGIAPPDDMDELARAMPPLVAPEADRERAGELVRALGLVDAVGPVVALHAGSGGAAKRWPPASFGQLAAGIRALGWTPLFVEGPQDAEVTQASLAAWGELRAGRWAEAVPVARELSVGQLAALLARCSAYVGNDSGVTHLAALVGTPTLALFGPSGPEQWRPLGRRVRALRSPTGDMRDLAPEIVREALETLLAETASEQEESTSLLPAH